MSITLMIQGTTSDAGKSTIVAGICRILARRGLKVAPFKPQNMALNSAVTPDGLEIGRAQALQAVACGVPLQVEFNPVLLKPTTDKKAQVIIMGKALSDMEAADYHAYKRTARAAVFEAYDKLKSTFDVIVVEGAGSPAEINLREGDIANMGFAEEADCPVLLVSDIDRGGVFAHCVGTLALLSESEQARTKGFIINRFRGDIALLQDGLDWLEARCDKKVVGVVPMVSALKLDAEDAIAQDMTEQQTVCRIAVLVFPRISNHTDFDPLRNHPDIRLTYVGPGQSIPPCDLIILPGSKNVRDDLAYLREVGWDVQIARHCRYGGKVLGICGGFQMLGVEVDDPDGIESAAGSSAGLGLLPVSTTLRQAKQLKNVQGTIQLLGEPVAVDGYEIHCGETFYPDGMNNVRHFSLINESGEPRVEGAISADGLAAGTYLHGLFEKGDVVVELVRWVCGETVQAVDWSALREQELDRLADILEQSLDWDWLNHLLGIEIEVFVRNRSRS